VGGGYNMTGLTGPYEIGMKFIDPLPASAWTSDALAGSGVR